MSKYLIATALFAVIAEAFIVSHTEGATGNFTGHKEHRVNSTGFLHIPVAKKHHESTTHKRQSTTGLRNDISGYSIQSEIS
jgi:hypothetical protein